MLIYRVISAVGVLASVTSVSAAGLASSPACFHGVCAINITDSTLMTHPCSGYSGMIAYSKPTGATIIQCSNPFAPTQGIIFDRYSESAPSFHFEDARFLSPEYLVQQRSRVSDATVSLPACDVEKLRPFDGLIIAEKEPNDTESQPYCYRISYIEGAGASLRVTKDNGEKAQPMKRKDAAKWSILRRKLTALIKP